MFVVRVCIAWTKAEVTWNAPHKTKSLEMTQNILLHHCETRCWSTWAITLYDWLCALNLRNVNEPAGLSGSLFSPGLSVSVERDCLDLTICLPLSHLTPQPSQCSNRLFPEQSMRGPQLQWTTAGLLFTSQQKKGRQMVGHEDENGWMIILISPVALLSNTPIAALACRGITKENRAQEHYCTYIKWYLVSCKSQLLH